MVACDNYVYVLNMISEYGEYDKNNDEWNLH